MENCEMAGVVRVHEEYKEGAYIITAENLPGLFLAGSDAEALRKDVPNAIKLLIKLNLGIDVKVVKANDPACLKHGKGETCARHKTNTWAALPEAA